MNRIKSILLTGVALALFAAPQVASAQSAAGDVTFLPPATGTPAAGTFSTNPGDTYAGDISADGNIVIGAGATGAVRWINGTPTTVANYKVHLRSIKVSGDGATVLSNTVYSPFAPVVPSAQIRTYLWSQSGGYREIPLRSANEDFVPDFDIDTAGHYVTVSTVESRIFPDSNGFSTGYEQDRYRAYRWTEAGGYQSLGEFAVPADDRSHFTEWGIMARAISGNGGTIAGDTLDTKYNVDPVTFVRNFDAPVFENFGGFVWTEALGLQRLPDLSASKYSFVSGISRDGGTVVGASRGADGHVQAVYWRGGSVVGLGYLPGSLQPISATTGAENSTFALAASSDGSFIVGRANGVTFRTDKAWRWSAATGMQDLNVFAQNAGLNLNGFVLNDAVGVSDNGQKITGNSFNTAQNLSLGYVLSIAAAPPPPTTLTTSARLIVSLILPGVTQTSIVNQTFSTQVDARLNGATVFTRTVGDQVTGTLGVTALADARTALQASSGLRRVVIGAPVLISNTTTVLSSSSNTVNVASGTQVTTAAVITNGPATVATGDLGTCATAATDGVNPTGCSLPGTPVAVNANVINTNTFTNTINSVTPTTTTTVNQLISAKWQVSATAGNQFGTVHALVGPAAFDRGDRLIGQLLGMGGSGGQGESANRLSRTAMPVSDASGFGSADGALIMFGGYFGNWQHTDADPSVPVADLKGSTNGFVLGLEKSFGAGRVGFAVDHGTSNFTVRDATYPETLRFKHTQVALFAGWQSGGFSLGGAAAYGFGAARTSLVTPTSPATAARDVKGWSLGAQAGYTVALGKSASVELVGGVRHVSVDLKAFTESGGPSPLQGGDQTVHRTRAYAGFEAQAAVALGSVTLTPRLHARYAHDSGAASGTADLVFASAPNGPVMQALGPGLGRDAAELGGSLDAAVGGNVHVWAGYDGTFRKGAQAHAAKAGITVVW
ncbi:autotransporter outer membrane beta-barrel domain-containing protein [Novosphingobium sp.]|uniref:autotransporter outer membrane beta-barrel domain-containing protein n=1 Tax=Novosphingobium sp. TaxID=1874826 RepID=UPI00286E0C23|nr:autotransporter outer membrane beta-barrel domain-containing protein [Novosphingobium sp.]